MELSINMGVEETLQSLEAAGTRQSGRVANLEEFVHVEGHSSPLHTAETIQSSYC
jgi:hypothetical protein